MDLLPMLAAASGAGGETDPDFNSTVLLLHGDGTNGAQNNTFLDSSTNNFTITRNGNVTQGSFAPFSRSSGNLVNAPYDPAVHGGSGYFDGSGDYLDVANSNDFDTDTTFTLECWYYQSASGNATFFARGGGAGSWSTSNGHQFLLFIDSGILYWMWNNAGVNTQITTSVPSISNWHHLAVGYDGTTTRFWLDGVSVGSSTTGYTLPTTRNIVRIGANPASAVSPLNGLISNLRFVSGTDVYGVSNTTITPPTAPLTAITNTSLLCNFTNAGIFDNTGFNNLETVGNAQIDTTTKQFGTGSMEFDGTGDYLFIPPTPDLHLGSGNWTIEFWMYAPDVTTYQDLIGLNFNTNQSSYASVRLVVTSGQFQVLASTTGSSWTTNTTIGSVSTNTWTHVALVRTSSTTLNLFINGVSAGTPSVSGSLYAGAHGSRIANLYWSGNFYYSGFIDDLRITKGVARYTTTFTPPDKAFPNIGS